MDEKRTNANGTCQEQMNFSVNFSYFVLFFFACLVQRLMQGVYGIKRVKCYFLFLVENGLKYPSESENTLTRITFLKKEKKQNISIGRATLKLNILITLTETELAIR